MRTAVSAPPFVLASDAVGDPRNDAQHDRADDGRNEVVDAEAGSDPRRQLELDRVEDDEEESERDDRQRQRQHEEDRTDDRVEQAEEQRGDGERNDGAVVKAGYQLDDYEERQRVEDPADQ